MMATNHPLASVAGAEVLLEGGVLVGASCRRADGTPVGISGGLAKPGVRFAV
jgi:gamma-glutamyltranspeptidase/glutathione hydrolase